MLTVEVLEGSRLVRQVPVAGLVKQYIGVMGYMDLTALNRLMREGSAVSGAYLATDSLFQKEIYRDLLRCRVAGTVVRKDEIRNFYETQAESMLFFTFVATLLAGVIAFGVVYNSARISLAERSRELASLRVLGYTRGEISYILLGELGLLTLAAIPLGFFIGRSLCAYIARAVESDLFRIPVVTEPKTYALAAAVVLVSAAVSGLIVRHRLDHLDLVAVLKDKGVASMRVNTRRRIVVITIMAAGHIGCRIRFMPRPVPVDVVRLSWALQRSRSTKRQDARQGQVCPLRAGQRIYAPHRTGCRRSCETGAGGRSPRTDAF
jgi:hypothetical protein